MHLLSSFDIRKHIYKYILLFPLRRRCYNYILLSKRAVDSRRARAGFNAKTNGERANDDESTLIMINDDYMMIDASIRVRVLHIIHTAPAGDHDRAAQFLRRVHYSVQLLRT